MADENNNEGTNEGTGVDLSSMKLSDVIKAKPEFQEELNSMMSENRKSLTKQNQDLVSQLEQLKQNTRLTQEERDELQVRITQLEEQYMSKEELAKRELTKKEKEYQRDLETQKKQAESWRNLYSSETIDRSLQDAAISAEAIRPTQIVDLLRGRTQLVEVLDDSGNPTGRFAPIVKFNDVNESGESVVLDLSPADALKRMKELEDDYGNLFKGTATGGLGESSASGASKGSKGQPLLKTLMEDPEAYAKWRKENPDLDLSKLRR